MEKYHFSLSDVNAFAYFLYWFSVLYYVQEHKKVSQYRFLCSLFQA